MQKDLRLLTACEWWGRVKVSCRTISGQYWPVSAADVYEYKCKVSEFLPRSTYLVRFTNKRGDQIVSWNHPEATPITISEFSKNVRFVDELLQAWDNGTPIQSAQLLVHYCKSCNRRLVIDGVHRIVHLVAHQNFNVELYVTELAGTKWPQNMPDMSVVCICRKSV